MWSLALELPDMIILIVCRSPPQVIPTRTPGLALVIQPIKPSIKLAKFCYPALSQLMYPCSTCLNSTFFSLLFLPNFIIFLLSFSPLHNVLHLYKWDAHSYVKGHVWDTDKSFCRNIALCLSKITNLFQGWCQK